MAKKNSSIRLLRSVELFLCTHYRQEGPSGGPLLLGLSGGYDSRALFEILLLSRRRHPFNLLVAHVDHGWREESAKEALALQELVESRGIPFFLHRIALKNEISKSRNLEDQCRQERLQFFESLYHKHKCQALLLAHQADDQAETVLKRLFEGAHFTSLGAMRFSSTFNQMSIWRPLLEFSKKEIFQFLESRKIGALDDPTNRDPRFLRARMRRNLLPLLEEAFGKNIRTNLVEIAKSFQEISHFFHERAAHYLSDCCKKDQPSSFDLSSLKALPSVEIEAILKVFLDREGIILGVRHLKQLVGHIINDASKKKLSLQKCHLIVDKGRISIIYDENLQLTASE